HGCSLCSRGGPSATSGVCFGCNKPGHLKRNCPVLKKDKSKTTPMCPRCCRGPHATNQCHCKYDSKGRLLQGCQGNWNQSVGWWCRALTQTTQPPSLMPALQMPNRNLPQVFA
ncbi:GAK5 protein, partial [Calyptomena viridis]|nr:GAK5 protein [Calyptomena viridis]